MEETCNLIVNTCCAVKCYFFYDGITFAGHFPSAREPCAAGSGFLQTKPKAYKAPFVEVSISDRGLMLQQQKQYIFI